MRAMRASSATTWMPQKKCSGDNSEAARWNQLQILPSVEVGGAAWQHNRQVVGLGPDEGGNPICEELQALMLPLSPQ